MTRLHEKDPTLLSIVLAEDEKARENEDRVFYWSLRNIIYPNESIIQGDDHLLDGLIRVA